MLLMMMMMMLVEVTWSDLSETSCDPGQPTLARSSNLAWKEESLEVLYCSPGLGPLAPALVVVVVEIVQELWGPLGRAQHDTGPGWWRLVTDQHWPGPTALMTETDSSAELSSRSSKLDRNISLNKQLVTPINSLGLEKCYNNRNSERNCTVPASLATLEPSSQPFDVIDVLIDWANI